MFHRFLEDTLGVTSQNRFPTPVLSVYQVQRVGPQSSQQNAPLAVLIYLSLLPYHLFEKVARGFY